MGFTTHHNGSLQSLSGKLLIASPLLDDPNFRRTVILLANHGEHGAMGVILNRPADTTVNEIAPELSWLTDVDESVFCGGPLSQDSLVALAEFQEPDLAAQLITRNIGFLSADMTESESEITIATRNRRLFVGHAGWQPKQLETEVDEGSWIVEPPLPHEIFSDDPQRLWTSVLRRMGPQYALLSTMPLDPSLN